MASGSRPCCDLSIPPEASEGIASITTRAPELARQYYNARWDVCSFLEKAIRSLAPYYALVLDGERKEGPLSWHIGDKLRHVPVILIIGLFCGRPIDKHGCRLHSYELDPLDRARRGWLTLDEERALTGLLSCIERRSKRPTGTGYKNTLRWDEIHMPETCSYDGDAVLDLGTPIEPPVPALAETTPDEPPVKKRKRAHSH